MDLKKFKEIQFITKCGLDELRLILENTLDYYKIILYICIMIRGYKYRLYPTEEQKVLLAKHFGCSRWIYNYALDKKVKAYQTTKESLSRFTIQKDLPNLKNVIL